MGSHSLFRHGTAVHRGQSRIDVHVQRLRNIRYTNRVLDLNHHVAVDFEVSLEPVSGDVPHQEVLRRGHPVAERTPLRRGSLLAEVRLFLCHQHLDDGRHRPERCHARHRLRRRVHGRALARRPGQIHRGAGCLLQHCQAGGQRRTGSRGRHAGRALRGCRRGFDTGEHARL